MQQKNIEINGMKIQNINNLTIIIINMATTASLELINLYAKFGLKRRPTYEEIVGLIGENDLITGKLPNRDATFFKASPQGSFFDGSNHLELLKDQEMRILDRQMREAMMKQEARRNGHTYAVHKMNTDTPLHGNDQAIADDCDFSTPLQTARQHEGMVDTQLQDIATATKRKAEEVGRAMAANLREMGGTLFHKMVANRQSAPTEPRQAPAGRAVADDQQTMRVEDVELSPQAVDDNFDATPVQQATGASSSTVPMTPLFKTTIDNTISPLYWKENPNLTVNDTKFQFYLRGIQAPKESEIQEELKHKGRGKARTHKEYLTDMILNTIDNGGWIVNLSKGRIEELKASFKGKGKK